MYCTVCFIELCTNFSSTIFIFSSVWKQEKTSVCFLKANWNKIQKKFCRLNCAWEIFFLFFFLLILSSFVQSSLLVYFTIDLKEASNWSWWTWCPFYLSFYFIIEIPFFKHHTHSIKISWKRVKDSLFGHIKGFLEIKINSY